MGRRSPLAVSPDKDGFACMISRLLMVVCTPALLGVPQDGATCFNGRSETRNHDGSEIDGPDGRPLFSPRLRGIGVELYGDVKSDT